MLTYFYLVFQAEISGNELLANLGSFILKIFQGIREHVPGLSRRPKKFSSQLCGSENFFLGQAQKSSYGPALANPNGFRSNS